MSCELSAYLADTGTSLVEAMEKINAGARGILFVIDEGNRLLGSVTDGDIRRWIIKNATLSAAVAEFMSKNPKSVRAAELGDAEDLMDRLEVNALPVLDEKGCVVDILFRSFSKPGRSQKSTGLSGVPVVITAGGKGTRLYPYTKILPKPLIPIGDIPIVERIIGQFCDFGCREFYMIVNHKKNMIKAYFNEVEKPYTLCYVDEEEPLGTGGGLSLLDGALDQTFFFSNCDILIEENFEKIYDLHKEQGNIVTMVCSLKSYHIPYGVVHVGKGGAIESMEEKPTVSFFTNTGCYVVEPRIFAYIPKNTNIGFPSVVEACRKNGEKVGVYPISEKSWLDMGQMDTMEQMRKQLEEGRRQ